MAGQGRQGPPETSGSAPGGLDTGVAHIARVYDYWLGGKDNFAVDREAAEQVIAAYPGILRDVRAQRAFLTHAVTYLAAARSWAASPPRPPTSMPTCATPARS